MKKLLAIVLVLLLPICLTVAVSAAGQVTDTLTVKVGYFGMATEDYVEVGTYHWTELYENLPLNYNAYSFYRMNEEGNYFTVIDSAYGFYISDLLDYVGIYGGDIQSFQFYTQDQSVGFFTSFTYADLFYTQRYFFNDLAAHIRPVYDEEGNFLSYDDTEAWGDCVAVQPMLALEDSWVTYEIGTEHTAPNYETMGTGNRFRLLFGQASPMESRTNQSAKYTHTIYVTLNGAPEISQELPEIDGTLGSHTTQFDVTVGNAALLSAISRYLQISSSDESVLEITGVTVTPNSQYSDLATVSFTYTVHRAGNVSLSIGYGGAEITQTPEILTRDQQPEPTQPETENREPTQPQTPGTSPAEPSEPGGPNGSDPSQQPAQTQPGEPTTASGASPTAQPTGPIEMQNPTQPSVNGGETPKGNRVYLLDSELARLLGEKSQAREPEKAAQEPEESVTALTVPEKDNGLSVLLTCLGLGAICLLGAGTALRYYHRERKRAV